MQHLEGDALQPMMIFLQNDAPPYWEVIIGAFLDDTFPERRIGHKDLTP